MYRSKTKNHFRCSAHIAATLAITLLAGASYAAEFTWDGQMTSSWGYSRNYGSVIVPEIYSNWKPDGFSTLQLPTSSDPVIFGEYTTSNRTVNLNGNRSVYSLEFKNSQDFTLTNGTLSLKWGDLTSTSTVAQTIDADIALQYYGTWDIASAPVSVNGKITSTYGLTKTGQGSLYLTNNDNLLPTTTINEGYFKIHNGGSVTNSDGYIGNAFGKLGTAFVTGANSSWTNTNAIHVGSLGQGTLGILDGGTVFSSDSFIGESAGSSGTVVVHGANSTWNSGGVTVGDSGQGILNIRGGSTVTSLGTSYVGSDEGSTGLVRVADANSTWNTDSLYLGREGEGTLLIEDGGTVLSERVEFGTWGGSTGIATVTGANSRWEIANSLSLSIFGGWINSGGKSVLNIENGGIVSSANGSMSDTDDDFATSIVTVTGANSAWNNSDTLKVGYDGDLGDIFTNGATLNVEWGGAVSAGNNISLNTNGEINLRGGTLRTANFDFSNGKAINFEAGKLHLTQSTTIDSNSIYDLDVRTLVSSQTLRVDGTTTLQTPLILNGGKLSTESIAGFNNLDLQSGTFELTYSDFTIGSAGIAGPSVNLPAGATIDITNNASIAADGVLNLSGGIFSAAKFTNNGTIIASGNTTSYFGTGDPEKELVHNGIEIRTTAGSKLAFVGPVSGSGDFTGPGEVYFITDYSPGNSTDIINFEGDAHFYGFGDNNGYGNLNIELAGLLPGEFDQLVIAGDASIDGYLAIDLLDGFLLSPSNEFEILDVAGTLSGQFVGLGEGDLVGNFGGEDLFISYTAGDGNDVSLFTAGLAGDVNGNGFVDSADAGIMFANWGASGLGQADGNLNGTGIIDAADAGIMFANWSASGSSGTAAFLSASTASVPEPSTIFLGVVASLMGIFFRRH